MNVPKLIGAEAIRNKRFSPKVDLGVVRKPKEKKKLKAKKQGPTERQTVKTDRDSRVKKEIGRMFGNQCFFAARKWPGCSTWIPERRQALEQMHLYGKKTHKGGDPAVRFNVGFSVLGCPCHHDLHEAETLVIEAFKSGDGEVYRTFEWGDYFYEDFVPSVVIE